MGERRQPPLCYTHTYTHTHQQDISPTHIPKQNTHCVTAPFVFFSFTLPLSQLPLLTLVPTLVLTSVAQPPITLYFLAFAAVRNCCGRNVLPVYRQIRRSFPNILFVLDHTAPQHLYWRAYVENYMFALIYSPK